MDKFPFLNLPSVVTHDILNRATPFDLFSLSLQSEEARNIVKTFSMRHKFHLEVFVNRSFLYFNQEDSENKQLVMFAHKKHCRAEHIFNFNGRFKRVPANIKHRTHETEVHTFYDKKRTDSGFKYLVEYLTSVFKNVSISLDFKKIRSISGYRTDANDLIEEGKRVKGIKDIIKKLKLNIINYNDQNGEYTFNDLIPIMKSFLDAPRYKPGGEISDKLRKALGLGDREIPEYIYRMRKLGFVKGYPPGYLKQAFQEVETVKFITEDPYFDKKDVDKPTPVPIIKNSKIHGYIGFNKHNQSLYGHSDRHQIPPFAVYCQMLQNEVERQHEDAQEKQREQSKKEKNTHDADQQLLQVAPKKEVVGEKDLQSRVIQENAPSAPMGSSVAQIIGTPVFPVKGSLKPLEDFAKGILPFERNEEAVVKRGLFDDIMKIIKDKKKR